MAEQVKRPRQKGRKIGRNHRHQCAAYRAEDRWRRNRKRRLRRHLRSYPEDGQAAAAYEADYSGLAHIGMSGRARRRQGRSG